MIFEPGLYIMNGGGFNIAGSCNVNGTGITVYNTADAGHGYKGLSINGSGVITLSAPTSGPYESMLFIGDRTRASNLGSSITGTSNLLIEGVVYLPREELTFTGGSGAARLPGHRLRYPEDHRDHPPQQQFQQASHRRPDPRLRRCQRITPPPSGATKAVSPDPTDTGYNDTRCWSHVILGRSWAATAFLVSRSHPCWN